MARNLRTHATGSAAHQASDHRHLPLIGDGELLLFVGAAKAEHRLAKPGKLLSTSATPNGDMSIFANIG
ncbi:hypothetical protein [Mesorhizobium sp. 113-1-2]|uniref:hypothetical protein n=1 Tax=Mesorhizobium sp. 113-1-2 TaxID=2744515 RepID=UPI00192686EC|nr:hypothetical protein [Mesorhizobium sp. 113-1-2]